MVTDPTLAISVQMTEVSPASRLEPSREQYLSDSPDINKVPESEPAFSRMASTQLTVGCCLKLFLFECRLIDKRMWAVNSAGSWPRWSKSFSWQTPYDRPAS